MSKNALKKFLGEEAFHAIQSMAVDEEKIRSAFVTPVNARRIYKWLAEYDPANAIYHYKALIGHICKDEKIGVVRETTQQEIIDAFAAAGYDVIFEEDVEKIESCKKYYAAGECICTYNNLANRIREYHMLVAVRKDIDDIERADRPKRDDEYGTSILNIQIARNGSHMSIKNRYNHTVANPDATLNNNLDMLQAGLQEKVLGYFGYAINRVDKFEFLNNANIIEIGNVYLCWETEVDNIYYGDFVLDSQNGVRFADKSRYFVHETLVYDFHKKEAIDLTGKNPRTVLFTKALKEGLINSGCKELPKAVFTFSKSELNHVNKYIMRCLYENIGYDFEKPVRIYGILGRFTAKSLEKETGEKSGTLLIAGSISSYVLCMRNQNRLMTAKLDNGKLDIIDASEYSHNIDSFYRKGDLDETRKQEGIITYFIAQDSADMRPVSEAKRRYPRYYAGKKYGVDKSGCDLDKSREALNNRLRIYKQNKRKNEAKMVDCNEDLISFKNDMDAFKKEISEVFSSVISGEDWHDLSWICRDMGNLIDTYNTFYKRFKKASFGSPEEIERVKTRFSDNKKRLQDRLSEVV